MREAIARESGIDLAMVRQAALEIELERGAGVGQALAGAPLRNVVERVVEGEVGPEHHEALALLVRSALFPRVGPSAGPRWAMPPNMAVLGRSLTVSGWTRAGALEVQVMPRAGQTIIRIESNAAQIAGGLFGGIIGGVGWGLGANVGWMLPVLLHVPPAVGLLGAAAVVLGAYGLARTIFVGQVRGLRQRMIELADRLASEIRSVGRT